MVKHRLDDGQAKAFDQRGRQHQFTILVAPFQLAIRNSAKEDDLALQVQFPDGSMNVFRLRTFDTDHHQQGSRIDLLFEQQTPEDPQSKHYVLVPAVLGNTEEKRLTKPRRDRTGGGDRRSGIDAVVDGDGAASCKPGSIKGETAECGLGNARDFVSRTQTLLQYQAVEQNLGEAKVRRNIVWVEVMKSNDRGAAERSPIDRSRIREVHDISLEPAHDGGQMVVVPEIAANRVVANRYLVKMEPGVIMRQG